MAMSAKDTLGAPPSVRPTADTTACADGGSGCAVSTCDITAAPGYAMSTTRALDAPSSICSPADAAIGRASPVDAAAAPAPLLLTFGMAPADSGRADRRVRLFFGTSLRGVPLPPTLQKTR
jgi:hypothetical protein